MLNGISRKNIKQFQNATFSKTNRLVFHKESNIKKGRKGLGVEWGLGHIKREGTTEFQGLQSLSQEDPLK